MDPGRRTLAETFDDVGELYHRVRPRYVPELFDDLVALLPATDVVEVGAGTGIATRALVDRGVTVTALEPGRSLARIGRREVPEATWVESRFEEWEPEREYDAVFAATAWHWVDPEVGERKAAAVARALAICATHHVHPDDADPFFLEIQEVYEEIGEGRAEPVRPDTVEPELRASDLWTRVEERRYLRAIDYDAEEYIDVLDTYSGHLTMAPHVREHLYSEIRRRVGSRRIRKHYLWTLAVALRR